MLYFEMVSDLKLYTCTQQIIELLLAAFVMMVAKRNMFSYLLVSLYISIYAHMSISKYVCVYVLE